MTELDPRLDDAAVRQVLARARALVGGLVVLALVLRMFFPAP